MRMLQRMMLAQDSHLLKQVNVGDRIRFRAEKTGGAFVVTRIEPAQ